MDTFLGLSGTVWTGIYTIFTLGLLIVAVVAALYARRQWEISREHADAARQATLEASRPYVIVTIEPSRASQQLFDLVVKNIGVRPAMDVTVAIDPPPVRARETPGHEIAKAKMLNEPIAMIAPGQEMRAFYDSHIERKDKEGLPTSHRVSLMYRDSSRTEYAESSVLDLEAMKGTMFTSVQTVHDIGQTLQQIRRTFDGASVLGRSGSLQVEASIETRDEQQRRLNEERAERLERHRELLEKVQPSNATEDTVRPSQTQADETDGEDPGA